MILQAEIWTIMVIQHSKDEDSKYRKYSRKKKLIHLVLARNKFTAETHRNSPELRNELKYPGIFFFFTAGVSDASEPRRNRVGETKKKEDTRRTPESGESYPFRCPTRVRHRHDAKNGVFVQPRIRIHS